MATTTACARTAPPSASTTTPVSLQPILRTGADTTTRSSSVSASAVTIRDVPPANRLGRAVAKPSMPPCRARNASVNSSDASYGGPAAASSNSRTSRATSSVTLASSHPPTV
jgi:uncharacterized Zn-binding protein involved in type VI secretion